jgi:hypothetical protein
VITKEEALELVTQYLAKQIHGELNLIENPPEPAYGLENPEDCYCIFAPNRAFNTRHIGASRIICISKITGKIVFDGDVGE